MELIRRASAEIEKLSLWRIFRNLWNDKAGSSLAHALGKAYLHQMPSFYDSNRDPSAMRKPTDSIEVMSAAPTVTRNRKPRQWGECFAPHLPLWIFKRGSATSWKLRKNEKSWKHEPAKFEINKKMWRKQLQMGKTSSRNDSRTFRRFRMTVWGLRFTTKGKIRKFSEPPRGECWAPPLTRKAWGPQVIHSLCMGSGRVLRTSFHLAG